MKWRIADRHTFFKRSFGEPLGTAIALSHICYFARVKEAADMVQVSFARRCALCQRDGFVLPTPVWRLTFPLCAGCARMPERTLRARLVPMFQRLHVTGSSLFHLSL